MATASTTLEIPDRPFKRADLGLPRSDFYDLVHRGLIRAVVREAYVRADVPDSIELRAAAVALVAAPGHVVVDRTAAMIHGVDTFTYAELEDLPPVETCALRGRRPTRRTGADGRTRDLRSSDIMEVGGLRVTTPLRTALDLGCNLRRREAMGALNAFARLHGVTVEQLRAELDRLRRRRGIIQLRELAQLVDARLESARESWTLLAIHDAGLPLPEPQVWIEIDGLPTYRLDFAYRRKRVCVEYDGFDFHELTEDQRRQDRVRREWLRANGWTVIVIRAGDFAGDRLDAWLRELRSALATSYTSRRW